ncbi:MAG: hypothetical protein RIS48_761 [Pseudomonadota bacterium]|jgi:hypothetical protein|uniref:hypothetical protein n=1 Tax=Malikia spinosa TaxID=86180 RepID=UPI003222C98D
MSEDRVPDLLVAYFSTDDALRSRSVSDRLLTGLLELPAPPARLSADWQRETLRLGLEAGDVEPLSLARSRTRWPDYRLCLQAMSDWMDSLGLPGLLEHSELALMACRGARYHHDAAQYGAAAFCNLFLSEDRGQDLHFPATGQRIPLQRGRVVIFDTAQPHAVIRRDQAGFDADDFRAGADGSQVFLSWELPIEQPRLASALGIAFDIDPATARRLDQGQIWLDGAPASLCPHTGRWSPSEPWDQKSSE